MAYWIGIPVGWMTTYWHVFLAVALAIVTVSCILAYIIFKVNQEMMRRVDDANSKAEKAKSDAMKAKHEVESANAKSHKKGYSSGIWETQNKQNPAEIEELDRWVSLCEKLTKRVGECKKEKSVEKSYPTATFSEEDIARQIRSQAMGMGLLAGSLPSKKPNDSLYDEAIERLNEYEAKKRA